MCCRNFVLIHGIVMKSTDKNLQKLCYLGRGPTLKQ